MAIPSKVKFEVGLRQVIACVRRQVHLGAKFLPTRIPILYVILSVLVLISVVPMYFYSAQVQSINRDRLITNERLLQNTVTRSIADDISQHQDSFRLMQANLASALQIASGGDLTGEHVQAPELRALLENFVSSSDDLDYATLLNSEGKGISAGRIEPDAFMQRELEQAYAASRDSRAYNGQPLVVGSGKSARTVMLVSTPVKYQDRFLGMIASVVDLGFLIRRLQEIEGGGLSPYVVDSEGRLVAGTSSQYATGQDMTNLEIVRNFVEQGGRAQMVAATHEFTIGTGKKARLMLGTYSPVTNLEWAVIVQKPRDEAYSSVYEMQRSERFLAMFAIAAEHLGRSYRCPPDYKSPGSSHRVQPRHCPRRFFATRANSRAAPRSVSWHPLSTSCQSELEHFILDLKRAAAENRELFMNSIQMLAGAVDEKDPYTRGHSDRVTKYSLQIAKEMDLPEDFMRDSAGLGAAA